MHYFIWNGINSRTKGLMVGSLPPIERAEERVEQVTIPGRAGQVTFTEGTDIYEPLERECVVYALNDGSYRDCLKWLRGDGQVIFSNEPDRIYTARIVDGVKFEQYGNSLRTATLKFWCHPYKGQWPKESNISISIGSTGTTVFNPGDIPAKPIIHMQPVTTNGIGHITIGDKEYEFAYKEGVTSFMLDCESGILNTPTGYDADIFIPMQSGLPEIPVGTSTITATGFTAAVTIEPRWRWL